MDRFYHKVSDPTPAINPGQHEAGHRGGVFFRVPVPVAGCPYTITIGEGLFPAYKAFLNRYPQCMVVSNETLYERYTGLLDTLASEVPNGDLVLIRDGEEHKSIRTLEGVYQRCIESGLGRDGVLVALGGGVVGDVAGFAAATYMRGIDYIQIPTTLLAMTDSSVGGKTGINLSGAKNMVGAFHQPRAVFADLAFLDSLPAREFNSALSEVIKYGLIRDPAFYAYIVENKSRIRGREKECLAFVIHECCRFKADIVSMDEREEGRREILNFGHTLGHALESCSNYQYYRHGEAVALGILLQVRHAASRGNLPVGFIEEFESLLAYFDLPTRVPAELEIERILHDIRYDKKRRDHNTRWIVLNRLGAPGTESDVDIERLHALLKELHSRHRDG